MIFSQQAAVQILQKQSMAHRSPPQEFTPEDQGLFTELHRGQALNSDIVFYTQRNKKILLQETSAFQNLRFKEAKYLWRHSENSQIFQISHI